MLAELEAIMTSDTSAFDEKSAASAEQLARLAAGAVGIGVGLQKAIKAARSFERTMNRVGTNQKKPAGRLPRGERKYT
jgi:hypothetical protein